MKKLAIYPGTFDPITNGHVDIVLRAAKLFDKIIVSIGENPQKKPLFSHAERFELVREVIDSLGLPNVETDSFRGLLVNYAKKIDSTIIIRGLRAISDFEHEFQIALANRKLYAEIETVFLMPKESYVYLSSSMVKTIALNDGDISLFVPCAVKSAFKKKIGGKK